MTKNSIIINAKDELFNGMESIYDSYSRDFFNQFHNNQGEDKQQITDWIIKNKCVPPYLELGCGYGEYTPIFSSRGKVVAVDISKNMIELAKKENYKGDVTYVKSDMLKFITDSKDKFKSIIVIYSLFHLPFHKIYDLIKESSNHLDKNGHLIMVVQQGSGTFVNNKNIPYTRLSYSDISLALSEAGFRIIETKRRAPKENETPFFKLMIIAKKLLD